MAGVIWSRRRYTKEEFTEAWNSSRSVAECYKKLGMKPSAGSYKSMYAAADDLGLTKDHMLGCGWNVGDSMGLRDFNTKPIETYLVRERSVDNRDLKKRLIKENLIEEKCYAPFCPITFDPIDPFTGEQAELKLTLDHIDGDNMNNLLENLRLLCYYCHPYTPTWGRGQRQRKLKER